ncbi:MAG: substrate-binding domain-containing protein [Acholeplasma sp.]|nr:substrate-binding domain-containing protein [Acholeplasma sp.]
MKKFLGIMLVLVVGLGLVGCGKDKEDAAIKVYTRDTSSGTRDAFFTAIDFEDAIKDDTKLVSGALIADGNGDMITKVKNDENGIGYISLTSLASSGLKGLSFNGVTASEANVLNGTYGLKRPFNYIITSNDTTDADKLAQAFNAYMKTKDAENIIKSKGGIVEANASAKTWDQIKADYPVTAKDNKAVTVRFGGSTSVESIAKELSKDFSKKAGNFVAEHNHTGSGAAFKSTQGADKDGDNALHVGFASRGFKSNEAGKANTFGQLAWDAVVAVVNSKNTLTDVTSVQLRQVYSGEVTTWSGVTGNDKK